MANPDARQPLKVAGKISRADTECRCPAISGQNKDEPLRIFADPKGLAAQYQADYTQNGADGIVRTGTASLLRPLSASKDKAYFISAAGRTAVNAQRIHLGRLGPLVLIPKMLAPDGQATTWSFVSQILEGND